MVPNGGNCKISRKLYSCKMTKHRVKAEILSNSFGTHREKKKEDTIAESIGQQSNDLLLAISC